MNEQGDTISVDELRQSAAKDYADQKARSSTDKPETPVSDVKPADNASTGHAYDMARYGNPCLTPRPRT